MITDKQNELVSSATAIMVATRGEVDSQVATARAFPRNLKEFREEALKLATGDEEIAESMLYTLPARGRDGRPIEGWSVRLAEVLAYAWKNLRAEANIESIDDTHITAVGTVFDVERNTAYRHHVKRRITKKDGTRFGDDMITTVCNAACSIAFREAVFKAIPRAYVNQIGMAAKAVAIGTAESLVKRRGKAFEWFSKAGANEKMVLEKLGRSTVEEVSLEDLLTLTGFRNAIKDGDSTIDSIFGEERESSSAKDLTSKIRAAGKNLEKGGIHSVVTEENGVVVVSEE